MKKVMSIDFETNGLWGKPISGAIVCYNEEGEEVDKICVGLNNEALQGMDINPWVKENVIPQMKGMKDMEFVSSYGLMMSKIAEFYMEYKKEDYTPLWHMGHVVEAFAFREMVRMKLIGEWDAPYCPIEVSAYLEWRGYQPDSVDALVNSGEIERPEIGSTHNPLYDCKVAYRAYKYLVEMQVIGLF